MSEHNCNMIFRCPYCLMLGNDTYLNRDQDEYYCLHCSFSGNLEEILDYSKHFRKKYKNIAVRVTLEEQREL